MLSCVFLGLAKYYNLRETETKEGGTSEEVKGYSRNAFMGVSNVPHELRSNASRNGRSKGKGQKRDAISRSECVVAPKLKTPLRKCRKCDQMSIDGHHKCFRCKATMEEASDLRLATEVARLESFAKESYETFALDQVTSSQPKAQRQRGPSGSSSGTSGSPRREGRSNFGVMRDSARSYVKRATTAVCKTGWRTIRSSCSTVQTTS